MTSLTSNYLSDQAENVITYIYALSNTSSSSKEDLFATVYERLKVELNLLSSNDPSRNR